MKITIKSMAFTLVEVLITLAIIGIVATLTLPRLISNITSRSYATQIKNFSAQIQQLATDQLVNHRTNTLFNTDFTSAARFVTNDNFVITKFCNDDTALTDCWKTSANVSSSRRVRYKSIYSNNVTVSSISTGTGVSAILKNGILFRYFPVENNDNAIGYFTVDVNGVDGPNIVGKDLFGFYVTPRGQIVDPTGIGAVASESVRESRCKDGTTIYYESYCYGSLIDRNWAPIE